MEIPDNVDREEYIKICNQITDSIAQTGQRMQENVKEFTAMLENSVRSAVNEQGELTLIIKTTTNNLARTAKS